MARLTKCQAAWAKRGKNVIVDELTSGQVNKLLVDEWTNRQVDKKTSRRVKKKTRIGVNCKKMIIFVASDMTSISHHQKAPIL